MTVLELDTPHGRANAHLHPADEARAGLVLGHGAAGGVTARDLVAATDAAREVGVSVVLVEQPYRVAGRRSPAPAPPARRCLDGGRRPAARRRVARVAADSGRSILGRARGVPTAAATGAVGVLCLAFPLQPPRRAAPAPSRLSELEAVTVPTLVVQGSRDAFGMPPAGSRRTVVQVSADHSLKTDLDAVAAAVRDWLPLVVG